MMNPWLLLGIAAAFVASYLAGRHDGARIEEAAVAREDRIAERAMLEAQKGAAAAIAAITVRHTTIQGKVEREIREKPVYMACSHGPDGLRLVNAALANGAEPAGNRQLPDPDPAGGPELRRDDGQAGPGSGAVLPVP